MASIEAMEDTSYGQATHCKHAANWMRAYKARCPRSIEFLSTDVQIVDGREFIVSLCILKKKKDNIVDLI